LPEWGSSERHKHLKLELVVLGVEPERDVASFLLALFRGSVG
jgi:hypothetical protein